MITFRKEPKVTGLASVGAGPQGYDLVDDGEITAKVAPIIKDRFTVTGWYFYMTSGAFYNSLGDGFTFFDVKDAKSSCKKYYVSRKSS